MTSYYEIYDVNIRTTYVNSITRLVTQLYSIIPMEINHCNTVNNNQQWCKLLYN